MNSQRLKGKTALITGASAGIGAALAEALAREGVNLVLIARRETILNQIGATLHQQFGVNVVILNCDVAKESAVKKALQDLPAPDILINNAGLVRGLHTEWETSAADVDEMIDTNIKGVLNMTRTLLPKMLERQTGDIINIGSISGYDTYAGGSVYCATKFALRALTDTLRKELVATPLRVALISPGMTETEFSLVRFRGDEERAKAVYQDIQPLTPQDIAEAILFILSRPAHVNIGDLVLFPTHQASVSLTHRRKPS